MLGLVEQQALDPDSPLTNDPQRLRGTRADNELAAVVVAPQLDGAARIPKRPYRGRELVAAPYVDRCDAGVGRQRNDEPEQGENEKCTYSGDP